MEFLFDCNEVWVKNFFFPLLIKLGNFLVHIMYNREEMVHLLS